MQFLLENGCNLFFCMFPFILKTFIVVIFFIFDDHKFKEILEFKYIMMIVKYCRQN